MNYTSSSVIGVIGNNHNIGNVVNSYNNKFKGHTIPITEVKRQVLEWLSPWTSRERHGTVRNERASGVGSWLLLEERFSTWHTLENAKPVLLCHGDPGVGKTHISSLVIDTLSKTTYGEPMAITYVYCDFTAREVQSVRNLFGSVLRQVIAAMTETPSEVLGAFEHARKHADGCRLRLSEILTMLVGYLSNLKRSFICIDALDEFPQRERPELWKSLRRLTQECPGTRLFLTGRPHIQEEVRKYFPETVEMLQIGTCLGDVGLYLRARLDGDPEPDAMDEELQADILKVIPEKISGIFLLVRINMDAILAEPTIRRRRRVLDRMTNGRGLEDAYSATVERIGKQDASKARLGMEALMWICHCERPLSPDELCHALGVELRTEDFDMDNVPSLRAVLGCTLGLVTVGKEDSTVRLLHLTLQEYLGEHPTLFPTAHSMMAEVCLTYLNSRFIRTMDASPDTALIRAPFLKYATCSWGTHTSTEVTETLKLLALRLLDGYENHLSAAILWREKITPKWHFPRELEGISGLHCIAFWGIAEIAIVMLEMKRWDVDARDSRGDTALMWAVRYGNDKVAELLLAQPEIESDVVVAGGHAVHSLTAQWGNEGVVKLLLEHADINPNLPDKCGRTPLSFAAKSGREGVVKLLLEGRDVNPNTPDRRDLTPLSYATIGGREDIVRLFRERGDANPDPLDSNDRSPISSDTEHRHQCALELPSKYGNPGSEAPETRDRTSVSISDEGTPGKVAVPLPAPGGATPYSMDSLLLDASSSRPATPRPPREQSLSRKQSLLNQPDSDSASSILYSILRSSLAIFLFLLPLLLLLVFHGYGDSHRLFHLISRTWQWLIQYFNFR